VVEFNFKDPYELANYMKNTKKQTPVKITLEGKISKIDFLSLKSIKSKEIAIVFGEYDEVKKFISENKRYIKSYHIEADRRNSVISLLDIKNLDARIEPGAIIRKYVTIGKGAIIMMGAVINVGAIIGEGTMIDMNAVIGARGIIGKNVHIGAGAVIAGILEPPSKNPVIIEDNVLIGANAVVLEGVRVGKGAVVGALSVVNEDVEENSVVVGSPARKIKNRDELDSKKVEILAELRDL
jgi:2,3,4,5-tetrahydropyridine-2,6-dicarboxylate N-acetyltransferase